MGVLTPGSCHDAVDPVPSVVLWQGAGAQTDLGGELSNGGRSTAEQAAAGSGHTVAG
jgi:hypothetical protein